MNRFITIACLGFLTIFLSCEKNSVSPELITMQIADHTQDCNGPFPQKCLLVKEDGNTSWQFFYGGIEGFTYEPGYEYKLVVKREKIENPPMDSLGFRYVLVEQLEKVKT